MTIKAIKFHPISLPYVEPFRTSFGEEPFKAAVLVELTTEEGVTGWGEAAVETKPGYGPETMITALHILPHFVSTRLVGKTINHPTEIPAMIRAVRGNNHAKAGVEAAVWDAFAKANDMRLVELFESCLSEDHRSRGYATVGVSIGIRPTVEATVEIIQKRVDQGYKRIKLKIEPGWDVELAKGVRAAFPDVMLMLDANSAYTLADADHLKQLDAYNLLMIEQPLGHEDIYQHSLLQPQLQTPICLDESIKSADDLRLAIKVGACRILNLKPARVGGFTESLEIYKFCVEHEIPLWIGGMLETGVGRAGNTAFASLPGVTLPCDISATDRYFKQDISEPPFVLSPDSTLPVPEGPGIGVEVLSDRVEKAEADWQERDPFA
ncbi:MAG: o-succinylbenzoate synthase [Anaerolineae bacterium]|nr:o-succinylbenzoate synthase [Anaerolineae bacterium]